MKELFQKGLSTNIAIAIIAAIALVAGGGITYYSYNTQKQAEIQQETSMMATTTTKQPETTSTQPASTQKTQIKVVLAAQNDSGESGTATLTDVNGQVQVDINVVGEPDGANQPAHIHSGACPTPGDVQYPLTPVVNGTSRTMIGISMESLFKRFPLAINIHKSTADMKAYIACGDIKADSAASVSVEEGGLLGQINANAEAQARMEARDARRISDMKQLAQAFILAQAQTPAQKIPCGSGKAVIINNANCTTSLGAIVLGTVTDWSYWNKINEQSSSATTACHSGSTASCATTIKGSSKTSNFEVCFYLETNTTYGPAGVYHIGADGMISSGCSIKQSSL
ncbi:MAG: hypothetical protein AAB870_04745 [Patescibacteria group bacterium]